MALLLALILPLLPSKCLAGHGQPDLNNLAARDSRQRRGLLHPLKRVAQAREKAMARQGAPPPWLEDLGIREEGPRGLRLARSPAQHRRESSVSAASGTLEDALMALSSSPGWTQTFAIDMSKRNLTGSIPAWLGEATWLSSINLESNQLTGRIPAELGKLRNLTELRLSYNQLSGPLPTELGQLQSLQNLRLFGNPISGSIPASLGNLSALTLLGLSNTAMEGPIPPELANARSLECLYLRSMRLTGAVPEALCKLSRLTDLGLDGNQLSGTIPSCLGQMPALQWINLASNSLEGSLPSELGNATTLQYLLVGSNNLTGPAPTWLGHLTELVELSLTNNQFSGPLPELGQLIHLQTLDLSLNQFSGTIPNSYSRLRQLRKLVLLGNNLQGSIPAWVGNLRGLSQLVLAHNQLSGPIPEIGGLSRLQIVTFNNNSLTGELPPTLGNLKNLQILTMAKNSLTGTIPVELRSLQQLQKLSLSFNSLSGDLPAALGNLSLLLSLDLGANHFTGAFPEPFCRLSKLQMLSLRDNQLTGTLPGCLGDLQELTDLFVDRNFFVAPLPPELGTLRGLQRLDLTQTKISGPLPDWIGGLESLRELIVDGCSLRGAIPQSLSSLQNLEKVWMWANSLSGPIPGSLTNLHKLRELHLGANMLSGLIPPELGSLKSIEILVLDDNKLSGGIPPALGNLSNLQELSLYHNQLEGEIPAALGSLKKLQKLYLYGNRLSGEIPSALAELEELVELDLSSNQLAGKIPEVLANLTNLQTLAVDSNRLEGPIPACLGRLQKLQKLTLQDNRLSGSIPPELGELQELQHLRLDQNDLLGSLPSKLGDLQKLQSLVVSKNSLSGVLPPSLGNMSSLQVLALDLNILSGPLPEELGDLMQLEVLNLANNLFTGSVPARLFAPAVRPLKTLVLTNNQLSGQLPPDLGKLQAIQAISIDNNYRLSGTFPNTEAASSLTTVNAAGCSFNNVSEQSPMVQFIDFSSNNLTALPGSLRDLGNLHTLKLANNKISTWPLRGVPQNKCGWGTYGKLFGWRQLLELDISGNPLGFEIQLLIDSLSYLTTLQTLSAARCGLTGGISDFQVGKGLQCRTVLPEPGFDGLTSLDLSGNVLRRIEAEPPKSLVDVKLADNELEVLAFQWWNLGQQNQIKRLDVRRNPLLKGPLVLSLSESDAGSRCARAGRGIQKFLIPDPDHFEPVPEELIECASLCTWSELEILVDPWTFRPDVMCRCSAGAAGSAGECKLCEKNSFSVQMDPLALNRTCQACDKYRYTADAGSTKASQCVCNSQSIQGLREIGDTCRCSEDEYIDVEASRCRKCPLFRLTQISDAADSREACEPTAASHMVQLCIVLLLALAWFLLLISLGVPAATIKDVSLEENRLIVTTVLAHHLLSIFRSPVPIKIFSTGHPGLDRGTFMAVSDSSRRLQLFDSQGQPVTSNFGTSQGNFRVCFPYSLWRSGTFFVPALLLAAALGLGAAFAMISAGLPLQVRLALISLAALLAAAARMLWELKAQRTPLRVRRKRFRALLALETPEPVPTPIGAGRAISAKQLQDFFEYFRGFIGARNMYYVVANILQALTEKDKLSYAEIAGPKDVTWFVSHFWGHGFQEFVATVIKHAQSARDPLGRDWQSQTYWICSFSNNQWRVVEELGSGQWNESSFYKALRSPGCQGTVMVLDQQALPLTRAWCLFEVLHTMLKGRQDPNWQGLLLGSETGVLNYGRSSMDSALALAERLTTLDLRDAEASSDEDLLMIHGLVEAMPGGFDMVNNFVRDAIKDALQVMYASFNTNVLAVVNALTSAPATQAPALQSTPTPLQGSPHNGAFAAPSPASMHGFKPKSMSCGSSPAVLSPSILTGAAMASQSPHSSSSLASSVTAASSAISAQRAKCRPSKSCALQLSPKWRHIVWRLECTVGALVAAAVGANAIILLASWR